MTTELKLMPVEPTEEMIQSGHDALMAWDARTGDDYGISEVYRAMHAAAPAAPALEPVAHQWRWRTNVGLLTVGKWTSWHEGLCPWPMDVRGGVDVEERPLYAAPVAPAPVAVKALEWSEPAKPCEECRYDHVKAQSGLGEYRIEWKGWKDDGDAYCYVLNDDLISCEDTLKAAKAAAQADYERRVRACLVDAPVAAGWQAIESAPHATDVLLAIQPSLTSATWTFEVGPASTGQRWPNGASSMSYHGYATHWMPLPAAPGEG